MSMDFVPVIDLAPLATESPAEKAHIAHQIGQACEGIGFFMVTGHGIDGGLI